MASKAISNPFFRHVTKRGYSGALVMPALKGLTLEQQILPSQTFISAVDNGAPVTRVTIAFKAGPRFESPTDVGSAHMLRAAAGLSTGSANKFILARKLAQVGATFTASGDREFLYYTVEATQHSLPDALECLTNIVSNQEFRPWELSDIYPRMKYDIAALPPQIRAVDLLHKAAYRRGLGNSLFISPRRIGTISSESLQHFAATTTTPARCAISIVGETLDKAVLLAQALKLPTVGMEPYCEVTKYCGGEMRKEMGGELAHVALALQGAPAGTPYSIPLAIAAKAMGNGPATKWGNDHSGLGKVIGNIGPFAAAGFNICYSDSGLYGVVLTVPKNEACNAVKSVAKFLRSPGLDSSTIMTARNQLKLDVLSDAEASTTLAESIAAQGLYVGTARTPVEIVQDIECVSDAQVCEAVGKAATCRLSMGAAGNLAFTPYVDEL